MKKFYNSHIISFQQFVHKSILKVYVHSVMNFYFLGKKIEFLLIKSTVTVWLLYIILWKDYLYFLF